MDRKALRSLKKGELVEIVWLDASTVRHVPVGEIASPDTLVKSKGRFLAIARSESKPLDYIVIDVEEGPEGQSQTIIPLPLVLRINRGGEREMMKQIRTMNYCRTVREYA